MHRPVSLVALVLAALVAVPLLARQPGPPVGLFSVAAVYDVSGEVAEIVDASPDGMTLAYSDSATGEVGFVNIANPAFPFEIDTVPATGDGEPTAVAYTPDGQWVLATVRDDAFGDHWLMVINAASRVVVFNHELPGQPDSVAVSPDGRYAAIAIENERDEDVDDGVMPQPPPGSLLIVDLVGPPSSWGLRVVSMTGLAHARFPDDPEPEFVDINAQNVAAVTLQENNVVALVDLASGQVIDHWSAGTTSHLADLDEDGNVSFTDMMVDARREPDAIGWTPTGELVTANEGDYDLDLDDGEYVGGRDFTIFTADGSVVFEPGASLEMAAAAAGFYDDDRSENKGCEIEGVAIGVFINHTYAFVGAERCEFVAVYRLQGKNGKNTQLIQILPAGERPEGLKAIPSRGLFVAASEDDGTIWIYQGVPGRSGS